MPAHYSALILAAALLQGPADASAWVKDLDLKGWSYLHMVEDDQGAIKRVLSTRSGVSSAGVVRMWSRYDDRDGASKSTVYLSEFDCTSGRSRMMQATFYKGRNMTGGADTGGPTRDWSYVIPGSVGEAEYKRACASAPSGQE